MPSPVKFLDYSSPFVIAEIGGNHEGSFERACELTKLAIGSGANAVKFQTYKADGIVSAIEGPDRHKHFKKFELSDEQFIKLARMCEVAGVLFMSSLWDQEAVSALDPYISIHKVGSGDLTNFPLLQTLARTKKPIILSTAMSELHEIKDAVKVITDINPALLAQRGLALLQCVAMYGDPRDEFAELGAIEVLRNNFPELPIGYSDHTVGTYAAELSVGLGAMVLELHFTDDKSRPFRDHALSITKEEMLELTAKKIPQIMQMTGSYKKQPVTEIETAQRIAEFRRSVCVIGDLPAGTVLQANHLTTLRPAVGLAPAKIDSLIGKKLIRAMKNTQALREGDVE